MLLAGVIYRIYCQPWYHKFAGTCIKNLMQETGTNETKTVAYGCHLSASSNDNNIAESVRVFNVPARATGNARILL